MTDIAGRYVLGEELDAGRHGVVFRALDTLTGGDVALKQLKASALELDSVWAEVCALRLLRLQGVVRLLDVGTDGGQFFIVMELVEGKPFPGEECRSWSVLAPIALRLLEVVARVHARGVIHRDIKPSNVLVSLSGQPTLLDFGLSEGTFTSNRSEDVEAVAGSLPYIAPEVLRSQPATPQADLYAIGAMLYQALSGQYPHQSDNARDLWRKRITSPPTPLIEVAPEVPEHVAVIIDRLLSVEPCERPASAAEVHGLLRDHAQPRPQRQTGFPRIGGDGDLLKALEVLATGQPVDVSGPVGIGLTRFAEDLKARLEDDGKEVLCLEVGQRPLESLLPLLEEPDKKAGLPLARLMAVLETALEEKLSRGVVVIIDDADKLDRWSAEVVSRCRAGGPMVCTQHTPRRPSLVELHPFEEADLQVLFSGLERLLHLRSDGARELWRRTDGVASRVVAELEAWIGAGLAHRDGRALSVPRENLDRLQAGLLLDTVSLERQEAVASLPHHLLLLQAHVSMAWPSASEDQLAEVLGEPLWRVEAEVDELIQLALVRRLPGGGVGSLATPPLHQIWNETGLRQIHYKMAQALPPGTEGRLFHLLMSGRTEGLVEEACPLALKMVEEGRLGEASAVLSSALEVIRRHQNQSERRLLETWASAVIFSQVLYNYTRVLLELDRVKTPGDWRDRLSQLMSLGYQANKKGGVEVLAQVTALGPFEDPELECQRQGFRIEASKTLPLSEQEAIFAEVGAWVESSDSKRARARYAGWLGLLRYKQGRFGEAAALHKEAAEGKWWRSGRLSSLLNSASASLEAFDFAAAADMAQEALTLAAECRHTYYEGRAEWILRSVQYRRGVLMEVDEVLLEATQSQGGSLGFLVGVYEAAVAWRSGDLERGQALAEQMAAEAVSLQVLGVEPLMRALAAVCRGHIDDAALVGVVGQILDSRAARPRLALQSLGLLGLVTSPEPDWIHLALDCAKDVPNDCWKHRLEVLSVTEALVYVGVRSSPVEVSLDGGPTT